MRKKLFLIATVITLLIIYQIKPASVYAAGWGGGTSSSGQNGSNSPGGNNGNQKKTTQNVTVGIHSYSCKYYRSISHNVSQSIDAYDMEGNSLIPNSLSQLSNKSFLSGTWIGINAAEDESVSWSVSGFEYSEKRKKYSCQYKRDGRWTRVCGYSKKYSKHHQAVCTDDGCCRVYISGTSFSTEYDKAYNEKFTCPSTGSGGAQYTGVKVTTYDKSVGQVAECRDTAASKTQNAAIGLLRKETDSFISVQKSNDDDKNQRLNIYAVKTKDDYQGSIYSGNCTRRFEYRVNKVCIDVKTAKVYYNSECDGKDEIKIINDSQAKDGKMYWHYFIPLSTKSNEMVSIIMQAESNNTFSQEMCRAYMAKYPNDYNTIIIPTSGSYIGDYKTKGTKSSDYKKKTGCRFAISVNFKANQKFYGEKTVNGKKTLDGYSFYVRPIDINNPFPNGVAVNSYWKEWDIGGRKNPNLKDSFKKETYVATNISVSSIKAYNKTHLYTEWDNMKLSGESTYIGGFISRNFQVTKSSFYKLGCGPSNKNWEGCK